MITGLTISICVMMCIVMGSLTADVIRAYPAIDRTPEGWAKFLYLLLVWCSGLFLCFLVGWDLCAFHHMHINLP